MRNYFASVIKIKIDEKILVEERIHAGDIVQHFNIWSDKLCDSKSTCRIKDKRGKFGR